MNLKIGKALTLYDLEQLIVTWYLIILIYIFLRFLNALQAFSFDEFCAHKHAYVHISSYDLFPDIGILYYQVVNQEHAFKHDSMSSTVRIHNLCVCVCVFCWIILSDCQLEWHLDMSVFDRWSWSLVWQENMSVYLHDNSTTHMLSL